MKLLLPLVLLFILASCNKTEYEIVYVDFVSGQSMAYVNEVVPIDVHFTTPTSAGSFDKFIESVHNTTRYIEVQAKFGSDGQSAFTPHTMSYSFRAVSSGTYYLYFKSGPSTYITITVVVIE